MNSLICLVMGLLSDNEFLNMNSSTSTNWGSAKYDLKFCVIQRVTFRVLS